MERTVTAAYGEGKRWSSSHHTYSTHFDTPVTDSALPDWVSFDTHAHTRTLIVLPVHVYYK